jgi:hypothetical protein
MLTVSFGAQSPPSFRCSSPRKALGLTVPLIMQMTADGVIE